MPTKPQDGNLVDINEHQDRAVNLAWERHQAGSLDQGEPNLGVRSAIHNSWVRSTDAGIDAQSDGAPSDDQASNVARLKMANEELCRAARESLDKIGRMLLGTEAMLVLTDNRGLVIEAIGDPKTLDAGRKINLHVGGLWNEHAVGTNGIGTALWAGEPMFVHGSEHYVETLKEWSCAAAPIRNPIDRSVIGAVDLSGLTNIFRQHNIAFAAAAAGEIQAALAQALNEERIRLLDALIEQAPKTGVGYEDGVVILDRAGRVLHRSGFERLILTDGTELDARLGRRLVELKDDRVIDADAVAASLPPTLGFRGINDLTIDGEVRGVAIVIDCERRAAKPASSRPRVPHTRIPTASPLGIVAECEEMLEAMDLARRVAHVNAPVLVQGETGTGKELFARLIHDEHSAGRETPFVAINCGAISRELFGAELFGHVDGAFTGAVRQGKAGRLEEADGGVFCLDEIGEMPLEIQPYLLRVLEERVLYRIGDGHARPFNARLVALTNRDLRAEVEAGRFRRDLYYRIDAVTVEVPPLRRRGTDILLLIDHFNLMTAAETGLEPLRFSDDARSLFLNYRWPGNVRELRNLIHRLHSISVRREVAISDLPTEISVEQDGDAPLGSPMGSLKDAEKALILQTIHKHKGNLSRVAANLGITRPTLYRKLKLYDIERVFR